MPQTRIRVSIDDETLRRLRELAELDRRPTADQAAVILERAIARQARRLAGREAKA